MYRTALLLLTASVSSAAPGTKEKVKGGELYFPIKEGTKLVLELQAGGKAIEVTDAVTKVEVKDSVYTVTVERRQGGLTATTVFEVSAKGVSRVVPGEETTALLKQPAKAGDTWAVEYPGQGKAPAAKATYTVGKEEEVEVPAGKFKAIPVATEVVAGGRTFAGKAWFAPGIGMVKLVSGSGAAEQIIVLKTFTSGK
jgi:hypothetical protein